jgi:hypothetical protein
MGNLQGQSVREETTVVILIAVDCVTGFIPWDKSNSEQFHRL